ncbi:hypothetical protein [Sulfuriroseicoccus oceanibius]|uniref:Uncharacterized protein n=1 Tax=Sulfuriroseicoccus oceanibius TaxID=2707525 RepID=A0A6B3LDW4_9BACT|nr:hypothetical protein [Sulfuriroseicoccus oceanibius]QQL44429.1 hypothetical protein G3M56_011105 [Sulfuriroseicoccus oceanibius]
MTSGVLRSRVNALLGTTSECPVVRVSDQPGFLAIEADVDHERWNIRVDLDSTAKAILTIQDSAGNLTEEFVEVAVGYFDRARQYDRPRKHGDTSIPERISFTLDRNPINIEASETVPGRRSIIIDFYDDSPISSRHPMPESFDS